VADRGSAWAVQVKCGDLKDIVIFADESAAGGEIRIEEYPEVSFSGRMGVVSLLGDKPVRLWMLGGSQLECKNARAISTPRYTGTITAIDAEGFAVEVDCPELPPGSSWSGQQMLVKGRSDGAYVMDRISREEGVTRIHLADEPIFTCEVGDEFTIVPVASVEMLGEGMWRVRGNDCSLVLDDSKSGPHTYTRLPGERWSAVERRDGTALSSRPGGERWVWAATEPIDQHDATPPVLTDVCIDERHLRPGEGAGYVPDPERIVFTFVERKHLLTEGVHAKLTGQRTGDIPLRVHVWDSETERDRVRVALRPDAHMPADEYTVEVEVSDAVANRAEYSLAFNTFGLRIDFREMSIVQSSGKISKFLSEYSTWFYRSQKPGDFVTCEFNPPVTGPSRLLLMYTKCAAYGRVQVSVDGRPVGDVVDLYGDDLVPCGGLADLGIVDLNEETHELTLKVVDSHPDASGAFIGVCKLIFQPQ
ncbi:MAG: hypothetical protein R6V19_10455, partial [Armatimonadota bacterium]